jgi:hypothetical protein
MRVPKATLVLLGLLVLHQFGVSAIGMLTAFVCALIVAVLLERGA